jgi:hypothetical protein
MKMMTKAIEAKIPALYSQEKNPNPTAQLKFFTPWSNWTWYVLEGEKQKDGDWLFFGYVIGQEKELGYFRLSELTSVHGPMGLNIERDLYFQPTSLKDLNMTDKELISVKDIAAANGITGFVFPTEKQESSNA